MSFITRVGKQPRSASLRHRMVAIYAMVSFGLLGVTGLIIHRAETRARDWAEAEMIGTARALGLALEGRFAAAEALLLGLAAVPSLLFGGDPVEFGPQLVIIARAAGLGPMSLLAPDGRMVLNSRLPMGIPEGPALAAPAARQVFQSGKTEIGELTRGPLSGEAQVVVAVPVHLRRDGAETCLCYALGLAIPASELAEALTRQRLPAGWVAAVIDRTGHVVARSERHDEFVGSAVIPAVRAAIEAGPEPRVVRTRRVDGVESSIALVRGGESGFRIAIAAPENHLVGTLRNPLRWALLAGISLTLAGLLLALLLAKRIARGVAWLGTLGEAPPAAPLTRTGLREIDRAASALSQAAGARERREAALHHQAVRFRASFEAAGIGMGQAELESGILLMVNARFCEILGMPEAALLNETDLVSLFGATALGDYRLELQQRGSASRTLCHHRPDGGVAWLRLDLAPILDAKLDPPRLVLVVDDITDQRRAEERVALMTREVSHRAMNALTLVQATLRLTPREDAATYAAAVEARVGALARAHARLAGDGWTGSSLRALADGEVMAFLPAGAGQRRVTIDGPDLQLLPQAVQPLAMILHELATNSAKHGALSAPAGQVMLRWRIDPATEMLHLSWEESGGPPVHRPPSRRGFGSRLLEATVQGQLGGTVRQSWPVTGLVCRIDIPLERLALADADCRPIPGLA
ncbi:HWE histidine kinase domain-containing protein [Belnapia rosea]|uniref:HWE histidine kinase domain-containing protein n=1 Tax=Belnapia rosea TaxID=938405 RepID=UPI00088CE04A|nr:HWE histidine kinase domain-containing protein [Belnapia rosea]SDB45857.1 PAS domain S-box-containing protein [Belnapia rosea]